MTVFVEIEKEIFRLFDARSLVCRFAAFLLLFRLICRRRFFNGDASSLFAELCKTVLTRFNAVREFRLGIVNDALCGELFDVSVRKIGAAKVHIFHLGVCIELGVLHIGIEESNVRKLCTGEVHAGQVCKVKACAVNGRVREVCLGEVSVIEDVLEHVCAIEDGLLHDCAAEDALARFAIKERSLVHLGLFESALGDDALVENHRRKVLIVEVHVLHVGLCERSLLKLSLRKIDIVKVRERKVCALHVHIDELRSAEVRFRKTGFRKVYILEFNATEVCVNQVTSGKVCLDDGCTAQISSPHQRTGEVCVGKICIAEASLRQVHIDDRSVLEVGVAKVRFVRDLHRVQASAFQVCLREAGIEKSRTVKVCFFKRCAFEVCTAEVCARDNCLVQVGFAEIRIVHHGVLEADFLELCAAERNGRVRGVRTGKVGCILNRFRVFKVETIDILAAERNIDVFIAPICLLSKCASGHRGEQKNTELGSQIEVHVHSVSLLKSLVKILIDLK